VPVSLRFLFSSRPAGFRRHVLAEIAALLDGPAIALFVLFLLTPVELTWYQPDDPGVGRS